MESFINLFAILPVCDDRCRRNTIATLYLLVSLYPLHQFYYYRFTFTQWDLLLFSGTALFIFGLKIVARVPE